MSPVGLFALGALVTLIVAAAMSLLALGVILDSRELARRKAELEREPRPVPIPRRDRRTAQTTY